MANIYIGKAYDSTHSMLDTAEATLAADIDSVAATSNQPSQATMLQLQYKMQVFSFFAEFISTFEKKVGEAFQGIVRNF